MGNRGSRSLVFADVMVVIVIVMDLIFLVIVCVLVFVIIVRFVVSVLDFVSFSCY